MPDTHDTLDEEPVKASRDDFISMGSDLFQSINWKIGFFILMIGIFVMSDVFISMVLPRFSDSAIDGVPTTKGTLIQLIVLTICYLAVDLLVGAKIL